MFCEVTTVFNDRIYPKTVISSVPEDSCSVRHRAFFECWCHYLLHKLAHIDSIIVLNQANMHFRIFQHLWILGSIIVGNVLIIPEKDAKIFSELNSNHQYQLYFMLKMLWCSSLYMPISLSGSQCRNSAPIS
jgi:hypothetical protein